MLLHNLVAKSQQLLPIYMTLTRAPDRPVKEYTGRLEWNFWGEISLGDFTCRLRRLPTIEHAPRLKSFQGNDLQGGAWHGRFHRQMLPLTDCCCIKLGRSEVAHVPYKRPALVRRRLTNESSEDESLCRWCLRWPDTT